MSTTPDDELDDPMLRALAAAPSIALGEPELPAGTIVGQSYRLRRKIGAGAMGVVYEATDLVLSRQVALKVHEIGRSDRAARLWREARAMAQLSHPHVVAVYEVGVEGQRGFIAMELVHGTNARGWREARSRSWMEVVEVYRQAGAGLSAAHDAGLVHRDFKPDNVLIGDDGRVRVADFGLALRPEQAAEHEVPGSTSSSDGVTRTGTHMGTPAYMAPEQARRERADARSDQYAFCVALHEALHGRRPGRTDHRDARTGRDEPAASKAAPDRGRDPTVPAWVDAALRRGLAAAPTDRWPSMHALLGALDPAPRRRRRTTWLVLLGAAVAGGILLRLGGWLAAQPTAVEPCRDAGSAIDDTWSPRHADDLRLAFETRAPRLAAAATRIVVPTLDGWAADWRAEGRAACEATNVRGEQSAERLDRRMDCLDRAHRRLVAVVDLLREADPTTIARADAIIASLPDVTMCARPDAAVEVDPVAPADAESHARLSTELARAVATAAAGRFAEAKGQLDPLIEDLRGEGFRRELGEALRERAAVLLDMGRRDAAIADATAATAMTMQLGDRDAMARATLGLARATGRAAGGFEAGSRWLQTARALAEELGWSQGRMLRVSEVELEIAFFADAHTEVERLASELLPQIPEDDALRVRVLSLLATSLERRSRYDDALARHDEALALVERIRGPDHPQTAMVLGNRAPSLSALSRRDDARASLHRVLEIRRGVFGPDAPVVGEALRGLADHLADGGDREAAIAKYEEAVAIHRAARDDIGTFFDLANLGPVVLATGDVAEAGRVLDEALVVGTRAFGADSLRVGQLLVNRSQVSLTQQDPARAVSEIEQALAIMGGHLPDDDLNVGLARMGLGIAHGALGHHDESVVRFDEGAAIVATKLPPKHPRRVAFALSRAQLLRDAGRSDDAIAQAREAATLADELLPDRDATRVDAWVGLATTLLAANRRAEAITALERARDRLSATGGDDPGRAAEIDAALKRARGRGREPDP